MRCDYTIKEAFLPVDTGFVLEQLASLPVTSWNYVHEGSAIGHMGPMAQDFRAAFGLGSDDRYINVVDAQGVTIAALQELYHLVQGLREEASQLRRENEELRRELQGLPR
jgi:hypothetical protein